MFTKTFVLCAALGIAQARLGENGTAGDNLYCDACTEIAGELEGKGCDLACDAIPVPGNTICSWMMSMTGLCDELVKALTNGETPADACADIGMCGGGDCECGVCTKMAAGPAGRCLGAPQDCGNAVRVPAWAKEPVQSNHSKVGFCLDGQCDGTEASYGCCLTCF